MEVVAAASFVLLVVTMAPSIFLATVRRRSFDLFEPLHWSTAYFALIFPLRSLYALTFGTPYLGQPPFDEGTLDAWLSGLVILGLSILVFFVGYSLPLARALAKRLPVFPRRWNKSRVGLVGVLTLALGLAANLLVVWKVGGLSAYLEAKHEALTAEGTTLLYSLGGGTVIAVYAFYIGHVLFGRFKSMLLGSLAIALFAGALSGSKGAFLAPLFGIAVLHHYLVRRVEPVLAMLLGTVAICVFPFFNAVRHGFSGIYNLLVPIPGQSYLGVFLHGFMSRFYGIDSMTLILSGTPRVMDWQLGRTYWPLLYAWIPRVLWPDKPVVSFGLIFAETYLGRWLQGTHTAASPTIPGEAYMYRLRLF